MLLEEPRKLVIETARKASAQKLVPLTFGNFSLRDEKSGLVCITPSGMPYAELVPEDIVVMDTAGTIVDSSRKPSIESPLHIAIYNKRPDVFGIVHTHSTYLTAWACIDGGMPCITSEAASMTGSNLRLAPFAIQGTAELAQVTSEALGNDKAVLMANHGAIFVGATITKAYEVGLILEESARVAYIACTLGRPNLINDQIMKALEKTTENSYGQDK